MVKTQTKIAVVFLLTSVAVLGAVVYLSSLDENDWITVRQGTHPPTVSVARDGPDIRIRWYGGWDSQFIDHLQVCTAPDRCQPYPKPDPGEYIICPDVPDGTTITVSGWDLAGRYYHLIAEVEM